MQFDLTEEQERFRAEVRATLAGPEIQGMLAKLRESGEQEPDERPLYRALGALDLLSVGWPTEYGGRGYGHAEATIAIEEMVRAGIPDTLHVNSIQIVGLFLLTAGTPEQKARYLPRLARGEMFGSVLYTEPGSGSDLGSLRTRAVPDGEGYRLTGVKVFSMKTHICDIALCAARTSDETSKYHGITLFVLNLHADGVSRTTVPSIHDEQFHRLELRDVYVGPDAVIGRVGAGWPLLVQALGMERTGLDYTLKAEKWYAVVLTGLDPGVCGALCEQVGRYGAAIDASRLLTWAMVRRVENGVMDATAAAVAKYYSSELAQSIACWAPVVHGPAYAARALPAGSAAVLESAYREAPGLTLSAGTSEVMLQIIAGSVLEDPARRLDEDAEDMQRQLREALRAGLAALPVPTDPHTAPTGHDADSPAWPVLTRFGAPLLETPASAGGLDLGLGNGAIVCEELGRAGQGSPYPGVAMAVDAITTGRGSDDVLAGLVEGKLTAAPAGFAGPPAAATRTDQGWRLDGETVASGDADLFCVRVRLDGRSALALLTRDRLAEAPRPAADDGVLVRFAAQPVSSAELLDGLVDDNGPVLAAARVRQGAYLLGLAEGAYEEVVRYAGRRRQFGQPLTAFQSVAFRLAESFARLAAVRLTIYRAAGLADTGRLTAGAAAEALALAAETAADVVRGAMQVCGARGLTAETLTQRYYRMIRAEAVRLGLPGDLWHRAGSLRLTRP